MDQKIVPVRGQTVLARNTAPFQGGISGPEYKENEMTYLMSRAATGGTILGGCDQKGNWSGEVDPVLAQNITRKTVAYCPDLVKDGLLDVISHNVGLRAFERRGLQGGERTD